MTTHKVVLPSLPQDEYFYISPEGFARLGSIYDPEEPLKHILWTNDYTVELPIPVKKEGPGSEKPTTLIEMLEKTVSKFPKNAAMRVKREGQTTWKTWTYEELYNDVRSFANALISLGINNYKALNIIGFNDPAWFITFFGSVFANVLPVGVYTTNGPEACKYVAEHCDCEIVIVENKTHLKKYLQVWDDLPKIKFIVVYNDSLPTDLPENRKAQVMTFDDLLKLGSKFAKDSRDETLQARKQKQKPGNCCTLVYTSGTTGLPKAVMLSHDNYTWLADSFQNQLDHIMPRTGPGSEEEVRAVSYLPLSHVAAQFTEMVVPLSRGGCVYFALPTALQGSLIETLKEVRPTFLLSVPRLWEKIEETLKNMSKSNGYIKKNLADWAKSMGVEGTFAEMEDKATPFGWGAAKSIVFNNVKKALGIDQCRILLYGAAPLSINTRTYFATLNIFLVNVYGMSENAGPETYFAPHKGIPPSLKSAGLAVPGTTITIFNPDKEGDGEICFRGRNRFMGYHKDDASTKSAIDEKGYLHSGDIGHIGKHGHLFITGRLKELIITAGGENVAPVLIENEIKAALPEISQCVIIGENKKYLCALITLKHEVVDEGLPGENLDKHVLASLKEQGVIATKVKDLRTDPAFVKYIESGFAKANTKAISRAQNVRKWYLLEGDFTVNGGEMTPTLKLKRKIVATKYAKEIDTMYEEPKL